jgi:nucleotide-binding universal stress UspA family protein
MERVVAVVSDQGNAGAVLSTAHALAARIDAVVQSLRVEQNLLNPQCTTRIMEASRADDVRMLVLPAVGQQALPISHMTGKPVALAPRGSGAPSRIKRLLIPHDGSQPTGMALAERFSEAHTEDMEVLLLHVLDERSLPSYSDQSSYEFDTWIEEFKRRYATFGGTIRVEVLRGTPALMVLAAADKYKPDLLVLGWSRQLLPGRAATVRQVLEHAAGAMMLLPVPAVEPSARVAWPSQVSRPAALRA